MAADAGHRQGRRGNDGHAPPGGGGRRLAEIGRLGLSTPAPQGDADRAAAFGAELKAPRCGHVEPCDFADDGAKAAMAEAFLDTSQHGLVVARLDVDHAIGREARLRQRWGEEIGPGDDPKNLAPGSRRDPGGEESRGRTVNGTVAAAGNFMECAEREATAGKARVDLGNSERKHRFHAPASAFDLLDLRAQ